MITYQKEPVSLVAVDQSIGDATVRLSNGKYWPVPICKLEATHGVREIAQAVRQCEERQRREQEATR